MVPVEYLAEATNMGYADDRTATADWDSNTNTTTLNICNYHSVQFTAGESNIIVDGTSIRMIAVGYQPAVAEIKGDQGHERMYIPLRAFGTVCGIPVDWDPKTQTAILTLG